MTMKFLLPILLLSGCAQFRTIQTDVSYDNKGSPQRTITTRVSAATFLDAKSALTSFKANQTDKTQAANVGSLSQESQSSTNLANNLKAVGELIRIAR